MRFLGVEIGGSKLQVVVGDAAGRIRVRERFGVDSAAAGEGIRRRLTEVVPGLVKEHQPRAIGVGFGGPVDVRTGRIACSHQVSGWDGFDLAGWFRELTGLPVAVENDANVAALGEALAGAGKGADPVFWINMGSGVGGGLVVGGALYHGRPPGEAEIGHVLLDREGTRVEDRCSGWAVDRRIRAVVEAHPDSFLARVTAGKPPGGEARHLAAALAAGDGAARSLLDSVADDLAFGLSHVVQLLHPEVVVLGGGLSLVGEPLQRAVAGRLPRYVMDAFLPGPRVVRAALGEDAVPVGALLLAGSRLDDGPIPDHA